VSHTERLFGVRIDDGDVFRFELIDCTGDQPRDSNGCVFGNPLRRSFKITEALAPRWRSRKTESVGITRWTALARRWKGFESSSRVRPRVRADRRLFIDSVWPQSFCQRVRAHTPAVWLSLRGRLHASGIQFVGGNANRLAVGTELMRNILGSQLGHQRLRIRGFEILEERLVVGRAESRAKSVRSTTVAPAPHRRNAFCAPVRLAQKFLS